MPCLLLLLTSCAPDETQQERLEELLGEATETLNDLTRHGNEIGSDLGNQASGEVEKLFIFEYKVFDLKKEESTQSIEEELNRLGKERWQCFHVEPLEKDFRFFCKRRPKTYLRYIPRFIS